MPVSSADPLKLNLPRVITVLVLDEADSAVPLARALTAGGINCIELTLRTPEALEAVRRLHLEVPEMLVGVGTILTPRQVHDVRAAGAAFGVAPGMNPKVVAEAQRVGLPFAPGVCTPTEIEIAIEHDCRLLKFFPCEPSGGLAYLRTVAAPFLHLGVRYIPLGGVRLENAALYLQEPVVQAIGGTWIAPRELIQRKDWKAITNNARETVSLLNDAIGKMV